MTLRNSLLFIIPFMLLLFAVPVFGATLKSGEEVTIAQSESITDDLYVAGGNVTMLGTVRGDAISAGGNVLSNGSVGVDLMAAGGTVQVLAPVGDDARIAGGQVMVGDRVGGDAVVAGGDVSFLSSSTVRGDVVAAGGRVVLDGAVSGDAEIYADEVHINGSVVGDVTIEAASVSVGEDARISGDFTYSSIDEADVAEGAVIAGELTRTESDLPSTKDQAVAGVAILGFISVAVLMGLLMKLASALVLGLLFKRFTGELVRKVADEPLTYLGWGFVTLVVTPVAAIILFVTVIGVPLGFLVLVAYGALVLAAMIFAPVVLGSYVYKLLMKTEGFEVSWKTITLGVVLYMILVAIPVVGWIARFLLVLVTLGVIAKMKVEHVKNWR